MNKISNKISYVFFGSAELSVNVLDELKLAGLMPALIVTYPDKQVGRKLILTENIVAKWARENNVLTIKESRLTPDAVERILSKVAELQTKAEVFVVAAYGRIIPKAILDIPKHGTLNVHPSLLPKYRGPSPILSAILASEQNNGVSIMLLDEEMDHGPIVAQEKVDLAENNSQGMTEVSNTGAWPMLYPEFEKFMGHKGGALLAKVLGNWVEGSITATPQNHSLATYTKKVIKEDGFIPFETLTAAHTVYKGHNGHPTGENAKLAFEIATKYSAYSGWPGLYTFYEKNGVKIRLKITAAEYNAKSGTFKVTRVIPEGKPETDASKFFGY